MHIEIKLDGRTLVNATIDPGLFALLRESLRTLPRSPTPDEPRSATLTEKQARELLAKIDPRSKAFLLEIARHDGKLTWGQMKETFGFDPDAEWAEFSRGYGKGITRALRYIVKKADATLVWWNDQQWDELAEDDQDAGEVYIDGPALEALKSCL